MEDAGDYECVAENEVGRSTAVTSIRVIEAPIIQLEPSDEVLSLTEGDELKVICSASGFPNPSVKWITENEMPMNAVAYSPVQPQFNQAYLEIYRVTQQDAKTYKCVASNEAGMDERYVTVEVRPRRGDAPDDSDVWRGSGEDHREREPYPYYPQPQPTPRPYYPPYQPAHSNVYKAAPGELVTLTCNECKYFINDII